MPDRSYVPTHPPTPSDRLLHHPYEVILAHWYMLCGTLLLVGLYWPEAPAPSPSISALPPWLIVPLSVTLVLGGALTMIGLVGWPAPLQWVRSVKARRCARRRGVTLPRRVLFDQFDDLRIAWWYERLGLGLSAAAWSSYSAAVFDAYPTSVLSWSLGMVLALVAIARFVASFLVERAARESVERNRERRSHDQGATP